MPPPARTAWLEAARRVTTARVAVELGQAVLNRYLERCPACNEARHRDSRGRLAASGSRGVLHDLRGWNCLRCNEGGDGVDFAALSLTGRRLRDCSSLERDEVRQFFARLTGESSTGDPTRPSASYIRRDTPPSSTPPSSTPAFEPEPEPELPRPPVEQLQHLWRKCTTRVDAFDRDDDVLNKPALEIAAAREVSAYLRANRSLDPTSIADANLAVVMLRDDPTLDFARVWHPDRRRWFRWTAFGYTLLLRLHDHQGVARSVLARRVRSPGDGLQKSTSPYGFKRARLVMANSLGRQMLQHGTHPSKWPAATSGDPFPLESAWWPEGEPFWLVIAEGELDYLTWATSPAWPESSTFAPAVLGIVSGSWHRCFAERIPFGTHVIISEQTKPDGSPDPAAQKYTAKIRATLEGRDDLTIDIWRAPGDGVRDEHDDDDSQGEL